MKKIIVSLFLIVSLLLPSVSQAMTAAEISSYISILQNLLNEITAISGSSNNRAEVISAVSVLKVGDAVQTKTSVGVRSEALVEIGSQPLGAQGVIVSGPKVSGEVTWWNINFSTGIDGWIKETNFSKVTTSPVVTEPVTTVPSGVTATFTASPVVVTAGKSTTLSWSSTNATGCLLDIGEASNLMVATSGSYAHVPLNTITYVLKCTGGADSVIKTVTVSVEGKKDILAPTIIFSSSPSSIRSGSSSTLSWSTSNAKSCVASNGWTGTRVTSGTQSVNPVGNTTYTLTCAGAEGMSVSKSVTVTVEKSTAAVKYFKYVMKSNNNESFFVKMTDPATIQQAMNDFNGQRNLIPAGIVVAGNGGFNAPWNWNIDPASVKLSQVWMEVCDARPTEVESNLTSWLGQTYCPWDAVVSAAYDVPPTQKNAFVIGDTVKTTAKLNVRSVANGTILGQQQLGSTGVVLSGPIVSGDGKWWNIDYTTAPDGWSFEGYLTKAVPVPPPTNLPTITFSASPTSISAGSSSTLTWTTTNATSCTASNGWTGAKATSGTQSVSPITSTTYTITCGGIGGSITQSVVVNVGVIVPPGNGVSLTPAALLPAYGPLLKSTSPISEVSKLDSNFLKYEQTHYSDYIAITTGTPAIGYNHYGFLGSRLAYAIRNGLPYGSGVNNEATDMYARGKRVVIDWLNTYSLPNNYAVAQWQDTSLEDLEALVVLENNTTARTQIHIDAARGTADSPYMKMQAASADPRGITIFIQPMLIAHRLGIPFKHPGNGYSGTFDTTLGSWASAAKRNIYWLDQFNVIQSDGTIISNAHGGAEAYFMSAMLVNQLIGYYGYVERDPKVFSMIQRSVDHWIAMLPAGWDTLPYQSKNTSTGSNTSPAPDLAGFYVYPSLVMWQETGNQKYYDFAIKNIKAANTAYIAGHKQFNQVFNTDIFTSDALLNGIHWKPTNPPFPPTGSPVPPPTNLPTITFSASPTSISAGSSSMLTWTTTNATSCTASNGWTGTKATSGTQAVSPLVSTLYTLTCVGTGGTTTKNVNVSIATVSGPITLPTQPLIFQVPMPNQTGKVWTVPAGDSTGFQTALNQAQLGDTIELAAGSTYIGNFTFPKKSTGSGWIVVRTNKYSSLPSSGVRVGPSDAVNMAKLVSTNTGNTISFPSGSHHYRLIGLDITNAISNTTYIQTAIVSIYTNNSNAADIPSNITLDRMYIHSQPKTAVQRCVHADGSYVAIVDSYLGECHAKGFDSQAIAAWNTNGPIKIVNNMLEGAGENVIFGGADPFINNANPSDIEIRNNYFYTPIAWKGNLTANGGSSLWTKKNLLEFKTGKRVLVEGNVFDGSWGDAQVGHAFVIKSSNQGGKCTWCQTTDLTIRYNVVKNIGGTGGVSGTSGSNNNTLGGLTSRVLFEHNIFQNINTGPYTGVARLIELYNNAQDVTYRNNTWNAMGGSVQHFISAGNAPTATNFSYTDNVAPYGEYGVVPGFTEATLKAVVSGTYNYSGNVVYTNQSSKSPYSVVKFPTTPLYGDYAAALVSGKGANQSAVLSATQNAISGNGMGTTPPPVAQGITPTYAIANTPTVLGQQVSIQTFSRILGRGMSGEDVRVLQKFLIKMDMYTDEVTGYFGPATESAVKKFQLQKGIVSSGDPQTTGFGLVGKKTQQMISALSE